MENTSLFSLLVNYLVFITAYGFFLFAGVKVARIEKANYGLCALISLGAGLVSMIAAYLATPFGLAGQVVASLVFLGLVFYLLVRVFNTGWAKAGLALLVSVTIPALISLALRLTGGPV